MSTPALTIPEFFPTQFGTTWTHLTQQKNERLRQTVTIDSNVVGRRKSYNQIGQSDDEEITTRFGQTRDMTRYDEKRWVSLKPYHSTKWFDEWDDALLGNIALPTSQTMRSMYFAYNRRCDKVIIDALGANALTGEDGDVSTPFDTNQDIGVNTGGMASNLNIEKLIQAKSLFGRNEVTGQDADDDPLVMVVSQSQLDALLRTTEVTSADFSTVKALAMGEVNSFMGFRFVRSEQLPLNTTTNVRTCYAYVRSGLVLSVGKDFTVMTDILPLNSHALQIRAKWRLGATRLEEEKVVRIYCDED